MILRIYMKVPDRRTGGPTLHPLNDEEFQTRAEVETAAKQWTLTGDNQFVVLADSESRTVIVAVSNPRDPVSHELVWVHDEIQ